MSWLHSLIKVLDEKEFSDLKGIRLLGKEKEVFQYILSFSKDDAPSQLQVCAKIQISDSHYYKINSILIDKLFKQLAPDGEFSLLKWLRDKELYPILKTVIKEQKKQAHSSSYFLNTFRLLIDLPFKYYDEKITKEVSKAYLNTLNPCTDSDKMYIQFHLLFADCNRYTSCKNPAKKFNYSEADLLQMELDMQDKKHYLAEYYLFRTLCNFYKYYKKESTNALKYLEKAIQLKEKIAAFFPVNMHQFLRLLYADALLDMNNVVQSFKLYSTVFQEGINEEMYGFHYHCEQFAIVSILLKNYDKAEELLKRYFDACIERKNDIYATRGALTYAKLYLSNGEYKTAQKYIHIGIEINEKSFYLPFEIQLRVLENIYFYFQKDYDFAMQLALRNDKFISSQKVEALTKNYRQFFKLMAALIQGKEHKKGLTKAMQQEFNTIAKNFRNVYGDLILMMNTTENITENITSGTSY